MLNLLHNFKCRNVPRVDHVIDSPRDFLKPAIQASSDKILAMADRIPVLINFGVALNLGKIVARPVQLIEWNPEPPDVKIWESSHHLFSQRFRSAIKTAVVVGEAKVRFVGLGETGNSVRPLGEQLGN